MVVVHCIETKFPLAFPVCCDCRGIRVASEDIFVNMAENIEDVEKQQQTNFVFQSLTGVIFHPVEYVKVLCQLGHEPIRARPGRNLFGRKCNVLPNVFQYIKHIKQRDGLVGCFTGLVPTFLGNLASAVLPIKILKKLDMTYIIDDPPNIIDDEDVKYEEYIKYGRREMTLHAISVIVSNPFRVITVRMMASFVGGEEGYSSMRQAISSIYLDNGIKGFFSGMVPRLLGDLACIGASVLFAYYVNKYFVKQKEGRAYVIPACLFISSTVTYPMTVVSTCMAINGSTLKAGNPPQMPLYMSWHDCFRDLVANKQHKRGASLLFRYQA
ncbi:mitochondrial carrier homolog 2-like [Arctopsyche grandis]|uniref:mitochondrial carrier homolog 2-like n=1 Tax=Arctopsyche grandis TaxID=121162 RepID=UPI00406D9077